MESSTLLTASHKFISIISFLYNRIIELPGPIINFLLAVSKIFMWLYPRAITFISRSLRQFYDVNMAVHKRQMALTNKLDINKMANNLLRCVTCLSLMSCNEILSNPEIAAERILN